MFLSDISLHGLVVSGALVISPLDDRLWRPASYLLRLGDTFRQFNSAPVVDLLNPATVESNLQSAYRADEIILPPNSFMLGITLESISIPDDHIGFITGMSHLGRIGIAVHCTASLISPGFGSAQPTALTLELRNWNLAPVRLYAGMPICHVMLSSLSGKSGRNYDTSFGFYSGVAIPSHSKYHDEFGGYLNSLAILTRREFE